MLRAALDSSVNGALKATPCIRVLILLLRYRRVFRSFWHMKPQPLSRVRRDASTHFDPDVLLTHPKLAVYPMATISRWARTDATLAELLSAMLKSQDLAVGMAMYQALVGGTARQSALFAAAEEALSTEDFWLLQAVIRANKPSRDQRNEFAHHLWGHSADVPNALLLVDPIVFVKHLTIRSLYGRGTLSMLSHYTKIGKDLPSNQLDPSKVQVYREPALAQAVRDAGDAGTRAFFLNIAVDRERFGQGAVAMRQQLLAVPAVQRVFEALSREKKKATPPQRRPKKPSGKQRRIRALSRKSYGHPYAWAPPFAGLSADKSLCSRAMSR
jgi:hypothetical protein